MNHDWLVCVQVGSSIRKAHRERVEANLRGLQLHGLWSVSSLKSSPAVWGMVERVKHVVAVLDHRPTKPTKGELVEYRRTAQRLGAKLREDNDASGKGDAMSRIGIAKMREDERRSAPPTAIAVMAEIISVMHRHALLSSDALVRDLGQVLPMVAKYRPSSDHPIAEVSLSRTAVEKLLPYLLATDADTRSLVLQLLDWLAGFEPRLVYDARLDRHKRLCRLAGLYGAHYGCLLDKAEGELRLDVSLASDLDFLTGGNDGVVLGGPKAGAIFRGFIYHNGRPESAPAFEHRYDGGRLAFETTVTLPKTAHTDRTSFVVFEDNLQVSKLALGKTDTPTRVTELR